MPSKAHQDWATIVLVDEFEEIRFQTLKVFCFHITPTQAAGFEEFMIVRVMAIVLLAASTATAGTLTTTTTRSHTTRSPTNRSRTHSRRRPSNQKRNPTHTSTAAEAAAVRRALLDGLRIEPFSEAIKETHKTRCHCFVKMFPKSSLMKTGN